MKKTFSFELLYFKRSGKYYSEGILDVECKVLDGGVPYMNTAVDRVKEMQRDKEPMPGLCGAWPDYILLRCEEGYECLIIPDELFVPHKENAPPDLDQLSELMSKALAGYIGDPLTPGAVEKVKAEVTRTLVAMFSPKIEVSQDEEHPDRMICSVRLPIFGFDRAEGQDRTVVGLFKRYSDGSIEAVE